MNVLQSIMLMSSLVQAFAITTDRQSIQNANPLNIDLSNPSETGLVNNGDAAVDEHKLGGYRPLYPPYFLRDSPTQALSSKPQRTYYDQEYYTRGAHVDDFGLDRTLTMRPAVPTRKNQKQATRLVPNLQVTRTEFGKAGSVHVKSTYSYSSVSFPGTPGFKFALL